MSSKPNLTTVAQEAHDACMMTVGLHEQGLNVSGLSEGLGVSGVADVLSNCGPQGAIAEGHNQDHDLTI